MRVYISADIEGIAAISHWDETAKKHADYAEFREQMTAEVVAACEGALGAGATSILIKDAHDTGRNLIPAKLPREAELIREWSGHPFSMMQELDDSFDAALLVGYHSRAGSGASPLAHTMSGETISVRINGQDASELMISAYTAGLVRVPLVFVSGDADICAEAQTRIAAVHTVAVKRGVGKSTINIHPHLAIERIRAEVKAALTADRRACQVTLPRSFSVDVRYRGHADAYRLSFFPGACLVEPHVVRFASDDYFDVLRFFSFAFTW